ncbi:CaiB/BaiF CoA transferase family protein [Candidatus Entotheonella palauensis]|uniref:CaiB/BaiF CoA transferase family protein n=1 Tax=Candidatus Entotheonella palauensis TaxID=93172 RepID=UPI000B7C5869|nr:CoA transferase [Candidatus Entotheonella palauensis]
MKKPILDGIRVLDFGRFIAAPYAGQLLADLGAEVVRVERPKPEPDRLRGPYLEGNSLYFVTLNRNKKSVAFEMFTDAGRRLLDDLIAKTDILISNFSPRAARGLGFTKERLLTLNPRLIVLSITAYGPDGPDAERIGFDTLAQARSGAMRCNGEEKPYFNHLPYVDFSTAIYGGFGLMAALYERERTGEGQWIDVSLMETVSAFVGSYGMIAEAKLLDKPRQRQGNSLIFALGDCLQAKDGDFVIFNVIGNMWPRLCEMIGHNELLEDERFTTDESRYAYRDEILPYIAEWIAGLNVPDILAAAEQHRIPFERVSTVGDLAQDAHAEAREMFPTVAQPEVGDIPVSRLGVSMSTHGRAQLNPAPAIGEHTIPVLEDWLGYAPSQFLSLRDEGVIP